MATMAATIQCDTLGDTIVLGKFQIRIQVRTKLSSDLSL